MIKFMQYNGDLMGLPTNENHINFLWCEPGCKVLFSVTRKGDSLKCHLASDKNGKPKIEQAINEFAKYLFKTFEWCNMIMGETKNKNIIKWLLNCGFKKALCVNGISVCVRKRQWV